MIVFKEEYMEEQFDGRSDLLKQMCYDFISLSELFGIEPVVTRVTDSVDGSSGVHEAGRGVDFRDEFLGLRKYSDAQASLICAFLNLKYQRKDGKKTCIHHTFGAGPLHFHIQEAPSMDKYVRSDIMGSKEE